MNDAFKELAQQHSDVSIAVDASLIDSFSTDNGLMESDDLHYSQRGDNAVANRAARYATNAGGIAPVYLVQDIVVVSAGDEITPPTIATAYRTDGTTGKAFVQWEAQPDASQPGTQVIDGTADIDPTMTLPKIPVVLIATIEEISE